MVKDNSREIAGMAKDIEWIKSTVVSIDNKLESDYITRKEYDADIQPIKRIVWAVGGLIITAFVGAVLKLILIK